VKKAKDRDRFLQGMDVAMNIAVQYIKPGPRDQLRNFDEFKSAFLARDIKKLRKSIFAYLESKTNKELEQMHSLQALQDCKQQKSENTRDFIAHFKEIYEYVKDCGGSRTNAELINLALDNLYGSDRAAGVHLRTMLLNLPQIQLDELPTNLEWATVAMPKKASQETQDFVAALEENAKTIADLRKRVSSSETNDTDFKFDVTKARCRKCRKTGHIIRDCPTKKKAKV
jgi:hypothetical protein